MNDHEHFKRDDADLREQARDWFVRMLHKPSAAEKAGFLAWRTADPAHDEAYRRVEMAWNASARPGERAAAQEAEKLAVYLEAMDRAKAQRKTSRRLGAASMVLIFLLGGAVWLEQPHLFQNFAADHVSQRGERRLVRMADGSTALLDADSAISENFTATERRITLVRGAAFFEVVPSATPFVVEAAGGEVTVRGTRFETRLLGKAGVVTLEHGSVAVAAGEGDAQTVLTPGQQVRFEDGDLGAVQDIAVEDMLAWRNGRFVFYRARLADVIGEIERYRPGRIVIVGSALAEERVTGSFPLADTDAALQSLQASVGFRMASIAGRFVVIRP